MRPTVYFAELGASARLVTSRYDGTALIASASTQLTDRAGRTPLQLAEARGVAAMVRLLRDAASRQGSPPAR